MQKITPCLWFDNNAEEAAEFYTSIFKESSFGTTSYHEEETAGRSGLKKDSVMVKTFKIFGQEFVALNGGPMFKFNESVSFVVNCDSQEEIDYYWTKLTDGGEESMCGWLKDKYGLSWQIIPVVLTNMMSDKTPGKSQKVMQSVLKMRKIDIAKIQEAYNG